MSQRQYSGNWHIILFLMTKSLSTSCFLNINNVYKMINRIYSTLYIYAEIHYLFYYFIVLVQSKSLNDSAVQFFFLVILLHGTRKMMTLQSVIYHGTPKVWRRFYWRYQSFGWSWSVLWMADRLYASQVQRQPTFHFNNCGTVHVTKCPLSLIN